MKTRYDGALTALPNKTTSRTTPGARPPRAISLPITAIPAALDIYRRNAVFQLRFFFCRPNFLRGTANHCPFLSVFTAPNDQSWFPTIHRSSSRVALDFLPAAKNRHFLGYGGPCSCSTKRNHLLSIVLFLKERKKIYYHYINNLSREYSTYDDGCFSLRQ